MYRLFFVTNNLFYEQSYLQSYTDLNMEKAASKVNVDLMILQSAEYFEEVNGEYRCNGTLIVCQHEDHIFHARVKARGLRSGIISYDELIDVIRIPKEAHQPVYQSSFTLTTKASACYVKRPSLLSYDCYHKTDPYKIASTVLAEVEIYEMLQQTPHPNIAQYFGCLTAEDRIVGICLAQYPTTLMYKANPEHRMKRQAIRYRLEMDTVERYVTKLRNALQHLHNLGLVHNDINPCNIMLNDEDDPIIIDFNSCCSIGHSLDNVRRTYEWHDPTIKISRPENDMDALDEIYEWLSHKVERNFKFAA